MIARLFKSKQRLDSKDAAARLAAIEALTESEAQASEPALLELCRQDPDPAVRQAALMRLTDASSLTELLSEDTHRDLATQRVMALIADGQGAALENHPLVLVARLSASADPEIAGALERSGDKGLLIDAVLNASRDARTNILELQVFHQADLLHDLERRSRDHDKTTNRLARSRLEGIRRASAEAQALTTTLTERLDGLERHTETDDAALQKRRVALLVQMKKDLSQLSAHANALAQAGTPITTLDALTERCGKLAEEVAAFREPEAPEASERAPKMGTEASTTDSSTSEDETVDFVLLTEAFRALDEALASSTDFAALAAERQALTGRWLAGSDRAPPTDAQHHVFQQVSHRFQTLAEAHDRLRDYSPPTLQIDRLPPDPASPSEQVQTGRVWREVATLEKNLARLNRSLTTLRWPEWAPQPEDLAGHQSAASAAEARLSVWRAHLEQALARLDERLGGLEAHLEAGELKAARADAGEIRKSLKTLPERDTVPLTRRLGRASARLAELSDWQTFATTPKRESLLEAMQEIADTPLPAKDQAHRIKELRNQWNELGPVGRAQDHRLQDAFNEAAERAFEPCRSYFAEQAELRADNLAARDAICASLSQYIAVTDWSNADFKAAERILRTAREEWRQYHPVDRSPGKAQEGRFEALQAELHEHIQAEWDRNLATKRQIVADAQMLAASDSEVDEKVAGAKRLQQQWKSVGATPRRPDQSLWRDFRGACDAIFNTLDEVRKHADEEIRAAEHAARELLADFRSRIDDSTGTFDIATLREFQQRFDELAPLPEKLARPLSREFDEILKAGHKVLRDQRSADALARLKGLQQQDEEVSAIEQRQMAGESLTFEPPDPFFAGRGASAAQAPVAEETLIRLTIEAEIAAGLESVESDIRMSIQVEMMNAGRGREALEASPEALAARWCGLGPKRADADPLRARFFEAIGRLNER